MPYTPPQYTPPVYMPPVAPPSLNSPFYPFQAAPPVAPAAPAALAAPTGNGKGKANGKVKGKAEPVIGSSARIVKYADLQGVVHGDPSRDLYVFCGQKKALISVLRKEFLADNPIICLPCIMSHLHDDVRFTCCDQCHSDPHNHGTPTSPAHIFPRAYRQRARQHFV